MIGQNNLRARINSQIEANSFPNFSILVGPVGSGKKLMCEYIAHQLGSTLYSCEPGVDAVRVMVSTANKVVSPTLYVIADADKLSPAARSALLKVTEETPHNARFILTVTNAQNVLDTLRSRAHIYYMDRYTPDELIQWANSQASKAPSESDLKVLTNVCETPGQVSSLISIKANYVQEFYDYTKKVVDNIALVSGANAFKIGEKIDLQSNGNGFDLSLFWKMFMMICADRLEQDPFKYSNGIRCTSTYLQDLRTVGINKQFTFDAWLLEIRSLWMTELC